TNTLRDQGMERHEALIVSSHVRLRPILMTTISIIAGMLPIAFGRGAGAGSRASMAVTIIGGQMLCLLLTLLVTPVVFSYLDDFRHRDDPARTDAPRPESGGGPNIAQFLRTGEVPVSLNDVLNMMLDNNLDIRSNRFTPRSQYFQSLVFYRALQPSLRFSGNVARDTLLSTTQLNGASARQQLNGNYEVTFS